MSTRGQPSRRAQRAVALQRRKQRRIAWVICGVSVAAAVVVGLLAVGGGDDAFVIDVALDDFTIEGDLVAPAGVVRLNAVNVGFIPHNVGVRGGPVSAELRPGRSADLDLGDLAVGAAPLPG